jgi:hypothetical protein
MVLDLMPSFGRPSRSGCVIRRCRAMRPHSQRTDIYVTFNVSIHYRRTGRTNSNTKELPVAQRNSRVDDRTVVVVSESSRSIHLCRIQWYVHGSKNKKNNCDLLSVEWSVSPPAICPRKSSHLMIVVSLSRPSPGCLAS